MLATSDTAQSKKIPDQYIVVLRGDVQDPDAAASDIGQKHGLALGHVYKYALKGFSAKIPAAVLDKVKSDARVSYIENDQSVEAFALETMYDKPTQTGKSNGGTLAQPPQTVPTGINRIDADLSSTLAGNGAGSVNVDIAIIDTGIDLKHPDLNVFKHVTFVKGTKTGNDDNGHGTHVAGISAAKDNSIGVVGVAPDARLWAVKVLDRNGSGFLSDVIKGIDYVTANAAQIEVANMSLGCECSSSALNTAITNSVAKGVTYVVAAGNSAKDAGTFSPANHPDVIAVSAIADSDGKCGGLGPSTPYGADDTFASFSNFGSVVDMAAPGVQIYSTYKSGTYATLSGTSMASPHVAGAAALFKALNPSASPLDVKNSLISNGSTPSSICDGNGFGYFSGDSDGIAEPLVYAAAF